MAAKSKYVVERLDAQGSAEKIEIEAERGEQEADSSRVTFYNGEDTVASFINIQGWYPKSK